ncbi:CpaB family protein [Nocardioides terrisoli]|uniref:hypothetical protein n=1 Tax=Nocardioides terrisoli TaxID=3388267 RepID=UPI00287B7D43|nr:hypothetical protein [Nocardioides marmorisolisilvae]
MSSTPAATRAHVLRWRDPRLVIGVAVMAACVLLGGWLLSSADDSVAMVVVRRSLPAGAEVKAGDLDTRRVRFSDQGLAGRYVRADQPPPAGATLSRPLSAGELLPRAALQTASADPGIEVPLSVARDDIPGTVRAGSVVDVWVVPEKAAGTVGGAPDARLVLEDVSVLALGGQGDALAPQSTRQVIVSVPAGTADRLGRALGRAASGRLVLTRRG